MLQLGCDVEAISRGAVPPSLWQISAFGAEFAVGSVTAFCLRVSFGYVGSLLTVDAGGDFVAAASGRLDLDAVLVVLDTVELLKQICLMWIGLG